jgi:hypothetical protein
VCSIGLMESFYNIFANSFFIDSSMNIHVLVDVEKKSVYALQVIFPGCKINLVHSHELQVKLVNPCKN